jgi:hypothetical protein
MRRNVKAEQVRRELLPNQSEKLLQALHLLTRDGKLNADALRKLKQVNHLVGLLTPALDDVFARFGSPLVVDVGSGNAYLGFVLYELFFAGADKGELLSVEGRAELTARAKERAGLLGFGRMRFETARLEEAAFPARFHLLTALHACDTATDDALLAAIRHEVDHVAVVPCCQAEVAAQLKGHASDARPTMASLFSHPMHRREFGSHLSNVIRALALEASGYAVTVTELTGWEHSLKNELILGRKMQKSNPRARAQLDALLLETGARPKLIRALGWAPAEAGRSDPASAASETQGG